MINLVDLQDISKNFTVLYVEDDDTIRAYLTKYLKKLFKKVDNAQDGEEGLEYYLKNKYDLVMTDIQMPKLDGLEMSKRIKNINNNQNILIVTAFTDNDNFTTSIEIGVDGYIIKPIDYNQLKSILYKIVYKIQKFKENEEYKSNLEEIVRKKTLETRQLENEKVQNYQKTLYALVQMIDDRDTYTGRHSQRVAKYSKMIAQELGFSHDDCENIYQAGILHDIGKIAIPDTILLKPGELNEIEYKLIQKHVKFGVEILEKIPMFKKLSQFINAHHERYDGSGYPNGLKGNEIQIEAQILAVADVFDAMTTKRIYKGRKTVKSALEEINNLKNIHFQDRVVIASIKVLSNIKIDKSINQLPSNALEQERFSYFYRDQLTQGYNEDYLDLILIQNSYSCEYNFLYDINLHNVSAFNNKYGWENGNEYFKKIYNALYSS